MCANRNTSAQTHTQQRVHHVKHRERPEWMETTEEIQKFIVSVTNNKVFCLS